MLHFRSSGFFFFRLPFFVCKNALIYRDGRKWQINGASCLCGLDVRRITKDFQRAVKKQTPREVDQEPKLWRWKTGELVKYSTCACRGRASKDYTDVCRPCLSKKIRWDNSSWIREVQGFRFPQPTQSWWDQTGWRYYVTVFPHCDSCSVCFNKFWRAALTSASRYVQQHFSLNNPKSAQRRHKWLLHDPSGAQSGFEIRLQTFHSHSCGITAAGSR